MVIVYWQSLTLEPLGSFSYARYENEENMYPSYRGDISYWIVPGTLED